MKYEDELNNLKKDLEVSKNLKYQAEARLEQLNKQEEEIINELNKLGVSPDNLESEIKNLEMEIENLFKEANSYLPKDLLKNKRV